MEKEQYIHNFWPKEINDLVILKQTSSRKSILSMIYNQANVEFIYRSSGSGTRTGPPKSMPFSMLFAC